MVEGTKKVPSVKEKKNQDLPCLCLQKERQNDETAGGTRSTD